MHRPPPQPYTSQLHSPRFPFLNFAESNNLINIPYILHFILLSVILASNGSLVSLLGEKL